MSSLSYNKFLFLLFQIMAGSTRSSAAVWLLGHPTSELSYARLPACGDVLRVVQYHHQVESMTLTQSYNLACKKVIKVWERS